MMMMQQAMPMDKPIVLMMLCSLSLRSNLIANIKKLESIGLCGSIGDIWLRLPCLALRVKNRNDIRNPKFKIANPKRATRNPQRVSRTR
jgi:hypothetical protein